MRVLENLVYFGLLAGTVLAEPLRSAPGEPCHSDFKSSIYVRPENSMYDPSVEHVGYPSQTACNGTYVFYFTTSGWPKAFPVSGKLEIPGVKLSKKKSHWTNKRAWETKIKLHEDIPLDDFDIFVWFDKSPGGYTGTLVNWVLKRLDGDEKPTPTEPEPTETDEPIVTPTEPAEPTKHPKHPKHPKMPKHPKHPKKGKKTPTTEAVPEPTETVVPEFKPSLKPSRMADGKYGQKVVQALFEEQF